MADSKLDDLTAETTFDGTERLYLVKDYTGTPADRKATLDNLKAYIAAGGGGGGASISSTPPVGPSSGDLWWNNTTGVISIYFDDGNSSQWVQVSGGSSGAVVLLAEGAISSPVTYFDIALAGSYHHYELHLTNLAFTGIDSAAKLAAQFSFDGGGTWLKDDVNFDSYCNSFDTPTPVNCMKLNYYYPRSSHVRSPASMLIYPGSNSVPSALIGFAQYSTVEGGGVNLSATVPPVLARATNIRLSPESNFDGTMTDTIESFDWTLYGVV